MHEQLLDYHRLYAEDIRTNNYAFLGEGMGSRGVRVYYDQYEK